MTQSAFKNAMDTSLLTLRDPDGVLLRAEDSLLRFTHSRKTALLEKLFEDEALLKKARLVPTTRIPTKEAKALWRKHQDSLPFSENDAGLVLQHENVFFPSFPYEWCQPALVKAGLLTLDFAEEALKRGWGIKDATPYNVLFEGTKPVFVDWLSLESRSPSDPTWLPFSQFVRCFLIPMWMENKGGMPLQACFLSHRDGLSPEGAYDLVPRWKRLTPSFFTLVTLPVWLNRRRQTRGDQVSLYETMDVPPKRAQFVLQRLFGFLRSQLLNLNSAPVRWTQWNHYLSAGSPYESAEWQSKKKTLSEWLDKMRAKTVLDVGCNEGWFSALAAQQGARVVGIDSDREMVRRTWQRADRAGLDIQPLLVDICRPSPAIGWKNQENASFLQRCEQKFDAIAALAVIHHLSLGEGISYDEIFSLMAGLTRKHFVVEFVGPKDPSFAWAAKGRPSEAWQQGPFLKALKPYFQVVDEKAIAGTDRTLYWLQKRKMK